MFRARSHRTRSRRLCLAASLALLAVLPAPAVFASAGGATPPQDRPAASPLRGDGMWIWMVSRSGGTPERIAEQADRYGIDVVYVKSGDAGSYWSQFSERLVEVLKGSGIRVCAWQFVYGGDPRAEALVGAQAVAAGADCLVIDAETHYEGRYTEAQEYVTRLRELVGPGYPLALTSFPYVDYHPAFPYSVFLGSGAARYNVPQAYWRAIGTTVRRGLAHTYVFNRPYGRPIFPLGQTWQDPSRKEILLFRRLARDYRSRGVSWWSWQETQGSEWRWVGRRLGTRRSGVRPARGFAALGIGSSGDLVVWAQQLLRAAGQVTKVNGRFGGGTAAAVRSFQESEGLTSTGAISAATWKALLAHRPAPVRWTPRREARVLRATGSARSASVFEYEFAPTSGRP